MEDIEVQIVPGRLHYYVKKANAQTVCTMMFVLRGRPDNTGVAEIHQINTKPKFRRQKHASHLIAALKMAYQGSIRYIYTSNQDSSPAGRMLMKSCGFKLMKNLLVWENEKAKPLVPVGEVKDANVKIPPNVMRGLMNGRKGDGPNTMRTPGGLIVPSHLVGDRHPEGGGSLPDVRGASVQGGGPDREDDRSEEDDSVGPGDGAQGDAGGPGRGTEEGGAE